MSTVNRLKNKKKVTQASQPGPVQSAQQTQSYNYTPQTQRSKTYNSSSHTQQKQSQYQSYYEISQSNPLGVSVTSTLFPHSHEMHSYYNLPLGFLISPLLFTQNEHAEIMQKSGDRIPRCKACRAYMNCYNQLDKGKFNCFVCGRESGYDQQYDPNQEPNRQRNASIFQCISPTNTYPKQPTQQCFIFLIDLNSQSAHTRMLYYAVAAMKQVLARQELDDMIIYFFTYDELIQQYDFSGQEIKCTVIDQTIQGQLNSGGSIGGRFQPCYLKDIRDKLLDMLDTLEERSTSNQRKGSNFTKAFDYVFSLLRHTGGKFFIFQTNQLIGGQRIFSEQPVKNPNSGSQTNQPQKAQSLFETKNKAFFEKYINQALQNECSFSFFFFERGYKNLKSIHDFIKLTNSQLKVYSKDSPTDLQKFYYDLYYILGATHYKNVRIQFIISPGWNYTAIYGNFYRTNQFISFQINSLEQSRKILALVTPASNNHYPYPFCSIQTITNYRYKRQSFMCVATIVQPVTGYLDRLYASVDPLLSLTAMAKGFLSSLRMDSVQMARKKLLEATGLIYNCALSQYKKADQIPNQITTIIMAVLAMLKSVHSQPELINNTPVFDRVLSQRNLVQFSGMSDLSNFFSPYLFDLTNLDESMCRQGEEFQYPPTIELKFNNVRDGLYLLDSGLALYLFVAKQCSSEILFKVFGKQKLSKNDELSQEMISTQQNILSSQITTLIKFLRQQKSYGWIPLYIIRCGQNTLNERNFYLFFYPEKYEEFRNYKMNLQEFLVMISKANSAY